MPKKASFSDNVFIKKVPKKGYAVFAKKPFKKGETLLKIKGKIISEKEADKCPQYDQDHMFTLGKNKYVVGHSPEKFINHSCDPNVYERTRAIKAIKDIKKGEELSFHYALNVLEDYRMRCHCRAQNCTGTLICGFFKLKKKDQKRLAPYLDSWFKKEFKTKLKKRTLLP